MRFETHKISNVKDQNEIFKTLIKWSDITEVNYKKSSLEPLTTISEFISKFDPKTLIIQKHVQDPDFLAEHSVYYSKWTRKVNRNCTRIHFFSHESSSSDPIKIIDEIADDNEKNNTNSYLGFVTLRPIPLYPVGVTILRKPSYSSNNHFVLSEDRFEIHMAGRDFCVQGTPFIQQDNAVGACAQASIWMALRTLRKKIGNSALSPAQITDAATRFMVSSRTLPNRSGLSLEQMCEAIRSAGYAPHCISLNKGTNDDEDPGYTLDVDIASGGGDSTPDYYDVKGIKKAIYPYVESGIPIILILESTGDDHHALLVVGHSWNKKPRDKIVLDVVSIDKFNDKITIYDASSWVDPFIVHNDNTGPYIELATYSDGYCLGDVTHAIALTQNNDFVDGEEAREISLECFLEAIASAESLVEDNLSNPITNVTPFDLVVRTALYKRSQFRKYILEANLPDGAKRFFREKWLPERFWLTEFNAAQGYEHTPEGNGKRVGFVLLDAASDADEHQFLAILIDRSLIKDEGYGIIIDKDVKKKIHSTIKINSIDDYPLVR